MPRNFLDTDWSEDDAPFDVGEDYDPGTDPVDSDISEILDRTSGLSHIRYEGAPLNMYQLLEELQVKYEELRAENAPENVCIAVRESCQTNSTVVVVYEKGGLQYHFDTRNLQEDFDLDSFKIDLEEFFDGEVFEIDHYVSDV